MKQLIKSLACLFVLHQTAAAQSDTTATPQWRPVYHFTPAKNWTNDPNGLIYRDGVYHLYNQQNPYENKWGHMSWGHASSTDLIHWKQLPVAMPEGLDKDTTLRFSGCIVWDKKNSSGFCKAGGCMVAVYTADQPNQKKESQFVAYSNDGGKTFTQYAKNPVIDLQKKDFRDPSVSWNALLKKWLMVVALPAEHIVQFYTSVNLTSWELLTSFGPEGYTNAYWECPSLMQLPIEGTATTKWVLSVSAAGAERGIFMQYFTGNFDGKTFKNDNSPATVLSMDDGDCFYAAIPWNDAPAGKNIFLGWLTPAPQPTWPWRGQMSIPRDLSLRQTKDGLRLIQRPASVIGARLSNIAGNSVKKITNLHIVNGDSILLTPPARSANAYWIDALLTVTAGTDAGFMVGQKTDSKGNTTEATAAGYNSTARTFYVDKTHSGKAGLDTNRLVLTTSAGNESSTIRVQLLFDRSSLEVFFNDGEKVISTQVFPGRNANGLSLFAHHGSITVQSLKYYDLSFAEKK